MSATNAETIEAGASLTLLDTTSITGGMLNNMGTLKLNGTAVLLKNGALNNTGTVNARASRRWTARRSTTSGPGVIDITGDLTLDHNSAITNVWRPTPRRSRPGRR